MANEISFSANLSFTKGGAQHSQSMFGSADMTGDDYQAGTVAVGSGGVQVASAGVTTPGMFLVKNLGPDSMSLGITNGADEFAAIGSGGVAFIPIGGNTVPYAWTAPGETATMEYALYEL